MVYGRNMPCDEFDITSNEQYIKCSGSGCDVDSVMAYKKAELMAKQLIVGQIQTLLHATTTIYLKNTTSKSVETESSLKSRIATLSQGILIGAEVFCYQTTRNKENKFESTIGVQIPISNIITNLTYDSTLVDWNLYKRILLTEILK